MSTAAKPSQAKPPRTKPLRTEPLHIRFDDNAIMAALFGPQDEHLVHIERLLDVKLRYRGNELNITGPKQSLAIAEQAIHALYERLEQGLEVGPEEVKAAVRMAASGNVSAVTSADTSIRTRKRVITARTPNQMAYMEALGRVDMAFGLGPAGTGKTYLAVAQAVSLLLRGEVERIILSRPAVEAGEQLGFLPGDLQEKVDPYLRPLYDALYDMLPIDQVTNRIQTGEIEVAPLAFMRGRTLDRAFIILDEAQNTSPMQMKMFLTRLGEGGRMAITGDMTQIDLAPGMKSGLVDCLEILKDIEGVAVIEFDDRDVVRHPMVARVVRAYNQRDKQIQVARRNRANARKSADRQPEPTEAD